MVENLISSDHSEIISNILGHSMTLEKFHEEILKLSDMIMDSKKSEFKSDVPVSG